MDKKIRQFLKKHWGYDKFRNLQEAIILSILSGNNTFALLPTGGGKSLCYQLPSLCFEKGFTLVISPLIALMKDQVDDLLSKNIKAAAIYGGLPKREIERILDNASNGYLKLLYVSPERLQSDWFKQRLPNLPINFIAVDEAHCISQWGHDFRPSYLKIAEVKNNHPNVPIIALTATATPQVVDDIKTSLKLNETKFFCSSFFRANLNYKISETDNKMGLLVKALQDCKGSSIVYVRSRQRAAQLAKNINQHGIPASFYHAGLNKEQRTQRQNKWIEAPNACMVCTSAFGMGIDKPNVRLVFHYDLTENLEAYLQESGRAGRDGKESECILAFNKNDINKLESRWRQTFPDNDTVIKVYNCLGNFFGLAVGTNNLQTFAFEINTFCKQFNLDTISTYYALKLLEKLDYLELSNDFSQKAKIKFLVSASHLITIKAQQAKLSETINHILRSCPGVIDNFVRFEPYKIAMSLGISTQHLFKQLEYLKQAKIIDYQSKKQSDSITFTNEYLSVDNLRLNTEIINTLKQVKAQQINAVSAFLQSNQCRQKNMLAYFGETDFTNCGKCDNCLNTQFRQEKSLTDLILDSLKERPKTIPNILNEISFDSKDVLTSIRTMLDDEILKKEGSFISKRK